MSDGFDDRHDDQAEAAIGYGRPPVSGRFQKGQSGNSKGRPRGKHREAPYEAVLGQIVTIRDGTTTTKVTAEEAFLLQLAKRGLEGNGPAARDAMAVIETGKSERVDEADRVTAIVRVSVMPGSVTSALELLRMAKKLDPYRPTARMALEPWIVEAALARMGDRRLSPEEQATVVKATRTPNKVNWPEWWEVRG
ncbi:DUF5681 domain-containing protein [Neogemmobacter tilapiae]|uniref:DUF5681 domain-containing protein n=1 Tax=Neogemmobacter tilapiae TaxID=875041 RepID=A0A918TXP5_9RHOB|nr:DUF5681 domain-containing protein [Gemmobacter tilapiae]GHC66494.1 hypothetical protein GCM10007315_34080 [Gemmobacter tilapiae]